MRLLFAIGDALPETGANIHRRDSARCIAIRDGKIAMVRNKYGHYKFPGGGIEVGETPEQAVIREAGEEAGLIVIPSSVREYGHVFRTERRYVQDPEEYFVQDNLYYLCRVEDGTRPQKLDPHEVDEQLTPVWVEPESIITWNQRLIFIDPKHRLRLEREAGVLRLLLQEGYFSKEK